jgi:hypothetical protein
MDSTDILFVRHFDVGHAGSIMCSPTGSLGWDDDEFIVTVVLEVEYGQWRMIIQTDDGISDYMAGIFNIKLYSDNTIYHEDIRRGENDG